MGKEKQKFEPRKRTGLDGKVWWEIWDAWENRWSTLVMHMCRFKTKKAAQFHIDYVRKILVENVMLSYYDGLRCNK